MVPTGRPRRYRVNPVLGAVATLLDTPGDHPDVVRVLPSRSAQARALRVVVADDAALFREGLSRLLTEAGFTVTAAVGDAAALLASVELDPPDVAVVDIRMPPTHTTEGLQAAHTVRTRHPGTGVLVLSAHVETGYALQLIEDGATAAGYQIGRASCRERV